MASRAGGDSHGRGFKMVEVHENPARSTITLTCKLDIDSQSLRWALPVHGQFSFMSTVVLASPVFKQSELRLDTSRTTVLLVPVNLAMKLPVSRFLFGIGLLSLSFT